MLFPLSSLPPSVPVGNETINNMNNIKTPIVPVIPKIIFFLSPLFALLKWKNKVWINAQYKVIRIAIVGAPNIMPKIFTSLPKISIITIDIKVEIINTFLNVFLILTTSLWYSPFQSPSFMLGSPFWLFVLLFDNVSSHTPFL